MSGSHPTAAIWAERPDVTRMIAPFRYHFAIYRREQLWLLTGVWILFALAVTLLPNPIAKRAEIGADFLGIALPLLAGVLSVSAVVDDPALELEMAAPRPIWWLLAERLTLLMGIVAATAVSYQGFLMLTGIDLTNYGPLVSRQLIWLAPTLVLVGLASVTAVATVQSTLGTLAVGLVWVLQLLAGDSSFLSSPYLRYLYLFLGARRPEIQELPGNQLTLLVLAFLCLWAAASCLRQHERYL